MGWFSLGLPDGIRKWLVMTFGSVFNLVWGSGLEFSKIRCRFAINICSNINVTFERGVNAIKITVIRPLLPSISDFLSKLEIISIPNFELI